MSTLALSRLGKFNNAASTLVVNAAANRLASKPMISMPSDDHSHSHDDHHMKLPNKFRPLTVNSFGNLLLTKQASQVALTSELLLFFFNTRLVASFSFRRFSLYFVNFHFRQCLGPLSVRYAHTDVVVPDFTEYRNSYTENPNQSTKENADDRQTFSYISTFGVGLATAYGAKAIVRDIVANVAPSADVLALAKVEVKLSDIPEGKNVTVKWRSKPLFIRHRTPAEIENERSVDLASLRDPQHDETRVKQPEWLILLGICTHLGKLILIKTNKIHALF
jgi:ubiquinol-cytochrome c reductase iron-sulfur subunit